MYPLLPWLLNSSQFTSLLWCGVSSPSTFSGSRSLQRGHYRRPTLRSPKRTARRRSTTLCIRLCPPRNRHEPLDRRRPRNCNIRSPYRRCRASQLCPVNVINFELLSPLSIIISNRRHDKAYPSALLLPININIYIYIILYTILYSLKHFLSVFYIYTNNACWDEYIWLFVVKMVLRLKRKG